jgi:intracellular proteinase inhibitor BsuPI
MNTRYLVPLLCAGAIVFACGPRTHSQSAQREHTLRAKKGAPLASSLGVKVDRGVELAFHVTNAGEKKLELTFPSGQTHDFVVLDSLDREVWRWSAGRIFTQSLQNKMLGTGETLSYEDELPLKNAHGRYVAVALLKSENFPVETRVEFDVP